MAVFLLLHKWSDDENRKVHVFGTAEKLDAVGSRRLSGSVQDESSILGRSCLRVLRNTVGLVFDSLEHDLS